MLDSALEPSYKVEKSFITAMDTEIDIDMVNDPIPCIVVIKCGKFS